MELTRVQEIHYNAPVESQKVRLVRLLRSERTGGVRRSPYGRDHSAVQSLRIYMCPAYKVPCFITERNSIAPVRGPPHLMALEVMIHS